MTIVEPPPRNAASPRLPPHAGAGTRRPHDLRTASPAAAPIPTATIRPCVKPRARAKGQHPRNPSVVHTQRTAASDASIGRGSGPMRGVASEGAESAEFIGLIRLETVRFARLRAVACGDGHAGRTPFSALVPTTSARHARALLALRRACMGRSQSTGNRGRARRCSARHVPERRRRPAHAASRRADRF